MTDRPSHLDDDAELALIEALARVNQLPVADGLDAIRRRTR